MPIDASARSGDPGMPGGTAGFSWKSRTRSSSSTATMPKRRPSADRDLQRGKGRVGALVEVEPQHLRVVHLVDVVAREHDHVTRRFAHDRVEVLEHRVGRAEIPVLTHPLLRRQQLDELAQLLRNHVPRHPDVTAERQRLVLRGDEDPAQTRVDAIAQGEVHDAVGPAEVHGRLGALGGQRVQPFARPARQQDHQHIVQAHSQCLTAVAPPRPRVNPADR